MKISITNCAQDDSSSCFRRCFVIDGFSIRSVYIGPKQNVNIDPFDEVSLHIGFSAARAYRTLLIVDTVFDQKRLGNVLLLRSVGPSDLEVDLSFCDPPFVAKARRARQNLS